MIEKTLERVLATFLNMERRWFYGKERFFNFISPWNNIVSIIDTNRNNQNSTIRIRIVL